MAEANNQAIFIIKKKVMAAGHHGGAWKVAYADFVTAMMAFFMVMWLVGSSDDVKQSVAGYFNDPSGSGKESGSGMSGSGQSITLDQNNMDKLKESLEQAMKEMPEIEELKDQVKMTVTGEGLRVELMETEKGMFFDSGSPDPSKNGQDVLAKLAAELGKMDNTILIEGHTDSRPVKGRNGYSNWELSGDRANAARRFMQDSGLRPDQVKQVRGFADQALMNKDTPGAPNNRRVSIIVQYNKPKPKPAEEKKGEHGKDAKAAEHGGKAEQGKAEQGKAEQGKAEHGKEEAEKKDEHAKAEPEKTKAEPENKSEAKGQKDDHGKGTGHGKGTDHGKTETKDKAAEKATPKEAEKTAAKPAAAPVAESSGDKPKKKRRRKKEEAGH